MHDRLFFPQFGHASVATTSRYLHAFFSVALILALNLSLTIRIFFTVFHNSSETTAFL
ncbi:MAG: hypothetical protein PHO05_07335 [bacterium]|nr:hypothetical protein [bacterium]